MYKVAAGKSDDDEEKSMPTLPACQPVCLPDDIDDDYNHRAEVDNEL